MRALLAIGGSNLQQQAAAALASSFVKLSTSTLDPLTTKAHFDDHLDATPLAVPSSMEEISRRKADLDVSNDSEGHPPLRVDIAKDDHRGSPQRIVFMDGYNFGMMPSPFWPADAETIRVRGYKPIDIREGFNFTP